LALLPHEAHRYGVLERGATAGTYRSAPQGEARLLEAEAAFRARLRGSVHAGDAPRGDGVRGASGRRPPVDRHRRTLESPELRGHSLRHELPGRRVSRPVRHESSAVTGGTPGGRAVAGR